MNNLLREIKIYALKTYDFHEEVEKLEKKKLNQFSPLLLVSRYVSKNILLSIESILNHLVIMLVSSI